ncbi:hypothetical protein H8D36_05275 [archaeon]|nr:hypothetical protein [archaeon]MBL7056808.1 hypothetical protein [Candidatus Woesearchaeota archaeon]
MGSDENMGFYRALILIPALATLFGISELNASPKNGSIDNKAKPKNETSQPASEQEFTTALEDNLNYAKGRHWIQIEKPGPQAGSSIYGWAEMYAQANHPANAQREFDGTGYGDAYLQHVNKVAQGMIQDVLDYGVLRDGKTVKLTLKTQDVKKKVKKPCGTGFQVVKRRVYKWYDEDGARFHLTPGDYVPAPDLFVGLSDWAFGAGTGMNTGSARVPQNHVNLQASKDFKRVILNAGITAYSPKDIGSDSTGFSYPTALGWDKNIYEHALSLGFSAGALWKITNDFSAGIFAGVSWDRYNLINESFEQTLQGGLPDHDNYDPPSSNTEQAPSIILGPQFRFNGRTKLPIEIRGGYKWNGHLPRDVIPEFEKGSWMIEANIYFKPTQKPYNNKSNLTGKRGGRK